MQFVLKKKYKSDPIEFVSISLKYVIVNISRYQSMHLIRVDVLKSYI